MLSARDYRRLELAALHSCGIAAVARRRARMHLRAAVRRHPYAASDALSLRVAGGARTRLGFRAADQWDDRRAAAEHRQRVRDTAIVLSLCAFLDKEARQGRPGAARLGQRLAAPRRAGDKTRRRGIVRSATGLGAQRGSAPPYSGREPGRSLRLSEKRLRALRFATAQAGFPFLSVVVI